MFWSDHAQLVTLAAALGDALRGRRVDGLSGGPGWLRLSFSTSDDLHPGHLHLVAKPGTILTWCAPRPQPREFEQALGRVRQQDLTATPWLLGAELCGIHAPHDDRMLFWEFRQPENGQTVRLAQQFFGQQGNLVLVDGDNRRLWSAHRSPHPALLEPPAAGCRIAPVADADLLARSAETAIARLSAFLVQDLTRRMSTVMKRAEVGTLKLTANLGADLRNAEQGDHYRHQGETLAIHLHTLQRGAASVALPDADGRELTIDLDPALSPAANMEQYFKKARRTERGRQVIADRLQDAESRLKDLQRIRTAYLEIDPDSDNALNRLLAWRETHKGLLERYDRTETLVRRQTDIAPRRFRRYLVEGRWEVWVGRDDRENDLLTHKSSAPTDWWFHAQGVAGSHVILRSGGQPEQIPRRILEKAASLAALHSKARNSDLAPVIYTLRKYVRKPRKAPPGTAACLREKSLMVEPAVPAGVETAV